MQYMPLPAVPWLNLAARPNLKAALNYIRNVYAPQMQWYAAQTAFYQRNMPAGQPLVPAPNYQAQSMCGYSLASAIWDEAYSFSPAQENWEMVLEGGSTMPFPPAVVKPGENGKTMQQILAAAMPGCQCSLCVPPSGGPGWGSPPVQAAAPASPGPPAPGQPCPSCRYVTCRCSRPGGPSRFSSRGMPGFDGGGRVPELVMPDVMGTAQGYRWWTLAAPDLSRNPVTADQTWPFSPLKGMRDVWGDGENVASCLNEERLHDDADIPHPDCSCGFWAYWTLQVHEVGYGQLPVCGVVQGYGSVEIGVRGFRAAKARIVALHLPFTIQPAGEPDEDPLGLGLPQRRDSIRDQAAATRSRLYPAGQQPNGAPNPWTAHPKFTGRVIGCDPQPVPQPVPELSRPSAGERQSNRDKAVAWEAVIGDRLAQMYPSATVYETKAAMEADYPPDLSYTQDGGTRDS